MFLFIIGINSKTEEFGMAPNVECPHCGRITSMKISVTYQVFHFFFIPLFKWGKRYLATGFCCDNVFSLELAEGKAFERGEKYTIDPRFLHPIDCGYSGHSGFEAPVVCPYCGTELPEDAIFCHRCGRKINCSY